MSTQDGKTIRYDASLEILGPLVRYLIEDCYGNDALFRGYCAIDNRASLHGSE